MGFKAKFAISPFHSIIPSADPVTLLWLEYPPGPHPGVHSYQSLFQSILLSLLH